MNVKGIVKNVSAIALAHPVATIIVGGTVLIGISVLLKKMNKKSISINEDNIGEIFSGLKDIVDVGVKACGEGESDEDFSDGQKGYEWFNEFKEKMEKEKKEKAPIKAKLEEVKAKIAEAEAAGEDTTELVAERARLVLELSNFI